ncbi:7523_t:CDS:1, partial [Paraglomus occultum]
TNVTERTPTDGLGIGCPIFNGLKRRQSRCRLTSGTTATNASKFILDAIWCKADACNEGNI